MNWPAVYELGGVGYALLDLWETGEARCTEFRIPADSMAYRAYLLGLAERRRPVPAVLRPRKNVIYVQMESVDGLVLGARYQGQPLMPFLESLARKEVYFANAIDNTSCGRTTDAGILTLTSLVPLRSAPVYMSQPLDRVPSLPKALNAAGYHTWSMHGSDGEFWRRNSAHVALGFDETLFGDDLDASERIGWGISDRSILHQAAQRIIEAKGPTFAHVILLTNHHPYQHVRQHRGLPQEGIVADYVESVRYVDESIAGFFGELAAAGVLQNCIIAVYGDHDSSITPQLERELQTVPERAMADTVPLFVCGLPEAPRRVDAVVGLQDVPVIVLEALGLPVPLTFTGNSLDRPGRTVAAYYGALESTPAGLVASPMPVNQEILTLLALRHPERLMEP